MTIPSLAAFHQLDHHLASEGFDFSGDTAADRTNAMTARDERDSALRAAALYGGSGSGGDSSEKPALEFDPKLRPHIKASVKVLQLWLNSPTSPARSSTRPRRSPPSSAWRPW